MAWKDILYIYDGTFEGFLCCVFMSYTEKENPVDITPDAETISLFPVRTVFTQKEHTQRVYRSLHKISPKACRLLRQAFLTHMSEKELILYRFIRKLYRCGAPLLSDLTDETFLPIRKALRNLSTETEHYRGFVRFSEFNGVLGSEIEPNNRVLPMLRHHFCSRYQNETFFIYDRTHQEALFYAAGTARILPLEDFQMAAPSEEEASFRLLWKRFYDTIAIRERENPRCRMSFMPKHHWKYMTEFQPPSYFEPNGNTPANAPLPASPTAIPAPEKPAAHGQPELG